MTTHSVSCELAGKTLTIETGKLARQANGAVFVSWGDSRVLVTVCASKEAKPGIDFFPLTVEFQERYYATGKFPGGFMKREGRPSTDATLSARMVDRPIRPLFPEGFRNEVQVVVTILSVDPECDIDVLAAAGASAALSLSDVPFNGPSAACRMGRINGQYVVCPSRKVLDAESDIDVLVAGSQKAILMVEGGASEVPEEDLLGAILKGHQEIQRLCQAVKELQSKAGKSKMTFTAPVVQADIEAKVKSVATGLLQEALATKDKLARYGLVDAAKKKAFEAIVSESDKKTDPAGSSDKLKHAATAFENLHYMLMRKMVLEGRRIDGRDTKSIRPIAVEVGLLPRTHGSALFTRGETQILASVTLGTKDDEQIIDTMLKNEMKRFSLHYNFPPYSVGEVGRFSGQSRREVGHGFLAERSVGRLVPHADVFPYTIRTVCETLESNGSSSMGSVCASSMAMMDAGVPFPKPVAGIAMGLVKEGSQTAILSDILGDEDHLGDMDFKVAGSKDGVTGIQMDIKIEGVTGEIMRTALAQAREGRLHILGKMAAAIEQPREGLSMFAPRITTITVPVDKIRDVIGSGGKVIKEIVATTGCKIDISDDGTVNIASADGEAAKRAMDWIQGLVAGPEVGKVYKGKIKKIVDFGAFVGILPNTDGLLHISEVAYERVANMTDHFKEGDEVEVKVLEVDRAGKVRLSRKVLLDPPAGYVEREPRGGGGGGDRGGPRGGGNRDRGERRPHR